MPTLGQYLVNRELPSDMVDYGRVLDKKGLQRLLAELADKHPDKYREVSHGLAQLGHRVAYLTGGNSFSLKHLKRPAAIQRKHEQLQRKLDQIIDDDSLTDEQREQRIILEVGRYSEKFADELYQEALKEGNPLARQVLSGARGNPRNLATVIGGDLLYTDHRGRVLPIPVLHSYAEGLKPAEVLAGAFGARKGVVDTKLSTARAGFLGKQLSQIAHRAVVEALDDDNEPDPKLPRGLPVPTDDDDSAGALLSVPVAGYKRNTILTPKILADLRRKGIDEIVVRSPLVGGGPRGGVYARDVGVREFGSLPAVGEFVGETAANTLSEPLAQGQLSSKHSGGVAGAAKAVSGFDAINQHIQVPKNFRGAAAHAQRDGRVGKIEKAPQGGHYVWVDGERHYVTSGFEPTVKVGQEVEAGDVLSEGTPDPRQIVKHKGIGEGKRYLAFQLRDVYRNSDMTVDRRNVELVVRNLVNHVKLNEELGDYAPGDVVPYSMLERSWQPRPGTMPFRPADAVGRYLERPVLHYSIGTKVRKSMLPVLQKHGIGYLEAHDDPPPFEPELVRGMANLSHDEDWLVQQLGSNLEKNITKSTWRGSTSDPLGTSFVAGLAANPSYGDEGLLQTPQRHQQPRVGLPKLAQDGLRSSPYQPFFEPPQGPRSGWEYLAEQLIQQGAIEQQRAEAYEQRPEWLKQTANIAPWLFPIQPSTQIIPTGTPREETAWRDIPAEQLLLPVPEDDQSALWSAYDVASRTGLFPKRTGELVREWNSALRAGMAPQQKTLQGLLQALGEGELPKTWEGELQKALVQRAYRNQGPQAAAAEYWRQLTPEQRQEKLGPYVQQYFGHDPQSYTQLVHQDQRNTLGPAMGGAAAGLDFWRQDDPPMEWLEAMGGTPEQLAARAGDPSDPVQQWQAMPRWQRAQQLRPLVADDMAAVASDLFDASGFVRPEKFRTGNQAVDLETGRHLAYLQRAVERGELGEHEMRAMAAQLASNVQQFQAGKLDASQLRQAHQQSQRSRGAFRQAGIPQLQDFVAEPQPPAAWLAQQQQQPQQQPQPTAVAQPQPQQQPQPTTAPQPQPQPQPAPVTQPQPTPAAQATPPQPQPKQPGFSLGSVGLWPAFAMFPQQGQQLMRAMGPLAPAAFGSLFNPGHVGTLLGGLGNKLPGGLGGGSAKQQPQLNLKPPKPTDSLAVKRPATVKSQTFTPV